MSQGNTGEQVTAIPVPKESPRGTRSKSSLLTILSVALVCLLGAGGYIYWSISHADQQTKAVQAELLKDGLTVVVTPGEPREAGVSILDAFSNPVVVRIESDKKKIDDNDLKKLRPIDRDLNLVLTATPVTDAGLKALEGMTNVRWLMLRKTKITDEGMRSLKGMKLQELDLSDTPITDKGLEILGSMDFPQLKSLTLEGTDISDKGLSHLENLHSLEFIGLAKTKVTKNGARHLKSKLPEVTFVHAN